jgi:hypothetical protein
VSTGPSEPKRIGDPALAWLCRAAVVVAIVGVFGTWRNASPVSLNGLEGPHNGWLVVIFALISLAGAGATARGSWLGIVTVLGCALVIVFTAIENVVDDGDVLGGRSGWGVWLTVAGGVVLGGAALAAAARRLRPRTESVQPAWDT